MKIGYAVEGSTDRAFVVGLKRKLCPSAELIEGRFRGSTGLSLRREIPNICYDLFLKDADAVAFLTDANEGSWHGIRTKEYRCVPDDKKYCTIYGVADRNIECWLTADEEYTRSIGIDPDSIRGVDPKHEFERILGITGIEKKEDEIAEIVAAAPIDKWRLASKSFDDFFEQIQNASRVFGCNLSSVS